MLHELGTVLSIFLAGAAAQIAVTPALCSSGYEWMFNSLGQSPCEVAAYLSYPCSAPNASIIPAAKSGTFYASSNHNHCVCNTVIWSLLTACSACQGAATELWPDWSAVPVGCSQAWVQEYPLNIPPGTRVPHWAYGPLHDGSSFPSNASAIGGLPESTGTPTSTVTNPPFTVSAVVVNRIAAKAPASSPPPTSTPEPPTTSVLTSTSSTDTYSTSSNNSPSNPSPAPATFSSTPSSSFSTSEPFVPTSTSILTFVSSVVSNITTQINGQPTTLLTTSLSTSLSTSIASSTQEAGSVQQQSDVGLIIGGVLGGLATLLIVAGGAYYLWPCRRRRPRQPSNTLGKVDLIAASGSVPQSYHKLRPSAATFPQRLYNPDDPSTFPDAPMLRTDTAHSVSHESNTGLLAHSQMAQV